MRPTNSRLFCLACSLLLLACATQAQSRGILHNFLGMDGAGPSGLISDAAGNLYGLTDTRGKSTTCCGTAYELSPISGGWKFTILHKFSGGLGGSRPSGSLVMDVAGNLFGVTTNGGIGTKPCLSTCGTVFELSPQPGGGWTFSTLYSFQGKSVGDGNYPQAGLTLDAAGSLYGVTQNGGLDVPRKQCFDGCGTIFKLSSGPSGWTETVLYRFNGRFDGAFPHSMLLSDRSGNLKGTTSQGGGGACSTGRGADGCGTIFELVPSGGGWTEHVLYRFQGADGEFPGGALIHDAAGNLYGTTTEGGTFAFTCCGLVYKLSHSPGAAWTSTTLYNFGASDAPGLTPASGVVMDSAGNLYGTALNDGAHDEGTFFKLAPLSDGSYSFSVVFPFDGVHGSAPFGSLVLDGSGNIYGTANGGGLGNLGVVYRLTP